jgi:hypothetical protein
MLKIRKEIIIEAGRGFFKRNNNDKVVIIDNNFPNKQIDEHVIEEFIVMTTLPLLSLDSKLVSSLLSIMDLSRSRVRSMYCFRSR